MLGGFSCSKRLALCSVLFVLAGACFFWSADVGRVSGFDSLPWKCDKGYLFWGCRESEQPRGVPLADRSTPDESFTLAESFSASASSPTPVAERRASDESEPEVITPEGTPANDDDSHPVIDMSHSTGDITTDAARLLVPFLCFLLLALLLSARLEDATSGVLSRSIMSMACGVVAGFLMRVWIAPRYGINLQAWQNRVLSDESMDKVCHPFIFLFIFPYLFWPSGWFARVDYLCYHWHWAILCSLGPIVSTVITAELAHQGHHWFRSLFYSEDVLAEFPIDFRSIWLIAACTSIIDPTPLLFAMGDLKVPTILSVTVLWESLFAPDTVIYLVELASVPNMNFDGLSFRAIWHLLGPSTSIFTEILPSVAFGFLTGLILSGILRTRWLRARPHWEAICIGWTPILAHAIATVFGLWGILADIPCGIAMALYGRKQLSEEGLSLADKVVTQNTILVCTAYYYIIGMYFTMVTQGLGAILGVWIYFCGMFGRLGTVTTCVPLVEAFQRLRGRTRPAEEVNNEYKTSRFGLMSVLMLGQTRGGVWFALYFKYAMCPQKALVVDAIVTVWFLSLVSFGPLPRILYQCLGMPTGADPKKYEGDGAAYDENWYTSLAIFRPFLMIHGFLDPLFSETQTPEEAAGAVAEAANAGTLWMGDASVPDRRAALRDRFQHAARSVRTMSSSASRRLDSDDWSIEMTGSAHWDQDRAATITDP